MSVELLVIIWIVSGIAALLIRQSRGDTNTTEAFLTGLILGPFGVLLALFGGEPSDQSMPVCVHCGKHVAKGRQSRCNHCGELFAV